MSTRQYAEVFSRDAYAELLKRQGGCCAICRAPERETFHVDHNHDTGDIRGLLCPPCNLGLGHFRDQEETLRKAADYLARTRMDPPIRINSAEHESIYSEVEDYWRREGDAQQVEAWERWRHQRAAARKKLMGR